MAKIKKSKKENQILLGILYGVLPHIGCISFIVSSIFGVTFLMSFFRPILLSKYFFYWLVFASFLFATLSSVIYLFKSHLLSFEGIRKKWKYITTMYGLTFGINSLFFFLIFPLAANSVFAYGGTDFDYNSTKTIEISVDIPCSGHAPLIMDDLKTIDGVIDSQYFFPNIFKITYDEKKTNEKEILSLSVFKEYPATKV